MNRFELQQLAQIRLRDAKALLATNENDAGAYYMAGYAVECAIKAVITKEWIRIVSEWSQNQQVDKYPDRNDLSLNKQEYYTHNIRQLSRIATYQSILQCGTTDRLRVVRESNSTLDTNWKIVELWSEESRYVVERNRIESEELINAVGDAEQGVLIWIQQYW